MLVQYKQLLVCVFLCVSPSLHHCWVPHPLIKSYFFLSASSIPGRGVWTAVSFKRDSLIEEVWLSATEAGNLWGSLVWVTAAGQAIGIYARYWINCPCRHVCVFSLNTDELGNRIRLSGLLSSPWAPSCTITSQGMCPGCTAGCLQPNSPVPSSLQRVVFPPAHTPFLLFGIFSRFTLVSPLIQLTNDPKVPCPRITWLLSQPRLQWGDSDHWSQSTEIQSAFKLTPLSALAKVVQHPALFPSPQSLLSLKRRNQVLMCQAQIDLQTPSQPFSLHLALGKQPPSI